MNVALTSAPPRELAEGVFWLGACQEFAFGDDQPMHVHNSTYLITGGERTLLFDTGYPGHWAAVENDLDALLGERQLDYVVPSHTETPHSGNLGRLLAKYPDLVAAGEMRDYHLYFDGTDGRFQTFAPGEELDLGGGYRFTFIDPVMRDLPNTMWGYEAHAQIMFTADGFIYAHHPAAVVDDDVVHGAGECRLLSTELPRLPDAEQAGFVAYSALYFTRYHDMTAAFEEVAALVERYPTALFAPTHGCVIVGGDDPVIDVIRGALTEGDGGR